MTDSYYLLIFHHESGTDADYDEIRVSDTSLDEVTPGASGVISEPLTITCLFAGIAAPGGYLRKRRT